MGCSIGGAGEGPGPGSYNNGSEHLGHKRPASFGFGSAPTGRGKSGGYTRPTSAPSAPGPGQYAHENGRFATKSSSPNHRFGGASRDQGQGGTVARDLSAPGPGAYGPNHNITKHAQPNYTAIPRRPQSAGPTSQHPGPGAYSMTHTAKADTPDAPQWRFGTSPRGASSNHDVPGPGNYNSRNFMGGGGPKFSIRQKHGHVDKRNENPGPGAHGGHYTQFD